MPRILIIEENPIMAECLERAVRHALKNPEIVIFRDAVNAMLSFDNALPNLILLDILPSGPDAFTLLNELASYRDTSEIPVILVSALDLAPYDLTHYGIVDVLHKESMTPKTISDAARKALRHKGNVYAKRSAH